MGVITGADGAFQLDLGFGLKYMAKVTTWRANLSRDMLNRTTVADDMRKRTAGLGDFTGDFGFFLTFSDDISIAQSAWQVLEFIISGRDDGLKAEVALIMQSSQVEPEYDCFSSSISGIVKLTGTVVLGDMDIDCKDPEQPIGVLASWAADGGLDLVRT